MDHCEIDVVKAVVWSNYTCNDLSQVEDTGELVRDKSGCGSIREKEGLSGEKEDQ